MKTFLTLLLATIGSAALHAQSPGYRSHLTLADAYSVAGLRSVVLQDGALAQVAVTYEPGGTLALSVVVSEETGAGRTASSYGLASGYLNMSDLVATADGGFLALCADMGNGSLKYIAARFDQQGDLQWSQRIQIPGIDEADYGYSKCYELPNGHFRLSLSLATRMVLGELDAEGDVLWARSYSGNVYTYEGDTVMGKDPSFGAAITDDGGAIITGKRESDGFLVRCDASGAPLWSLAYPNGEYTHIRGIKRLADGHFAIAGFRGTHSFLSKIDADGNVLWAKTYVDQDFLLYNAGFETILESQNGDLVVVTPPNGLTTVIMRTDASGEPIAAFRARQNYALSDLRLVAAQGTVIRTSGIITDFTSYTGRIVEGRMDLDGGSDCAFLPLQVVAFDEAPITPETVDAYSAPFGITAAPITLVPVALTAGNEDVCAMLVGVEELPKEHLLLSPSIVEAGGVMRVTGLGEGLHALVIHDAAGALVRSTSILENGTLSTQGLAAGIYAVRLVDGPTARVPLRFVVR